MTDADTESSLADLIRASIFAGDVVPNQRLVEIDLCDRYSVARSTVRDALAKLTSEGLVERVQNRSARVRAISLEEAIEISEVRLALEGLCAFKAAERITDDEAVELRQIGAEMTNAVASGDLLAYSANNRKLHSRVGEISRQTTAREIIRRARAQVVRYQYRLAMEPGRPSVSLPEHLAIIEAVCSHDADGAERALRVHLSSVIEALRAASDRHGLAMGRA